MALDQEIKMKNLVYLFFSIFICLCFIGCKLNINNQLLEMKDNDAYFTNRPTPDSFPAQYSRRERKRNRKLTKRHTRQVCGVNSAAREAIERSDRLHKARENHIITI